jgi:tetratricopeptide (TPR) repeat protein/predicted aspartyl protease
VSVIRKVFAALFLALITASSAGAKCQLGKLLDIKIMMQGTRPLTELGINGHPLQFIVDSGAFYSTISPGTAAELGLKLEPSPVQMVGIGGEAGTTSVATVKSVDLAGVALHDIDFIVGGSETGVAGLLGQNVLGIGDVDYDLGHGSVHLMRSRGCSANDDLAYWAGDRPVSDLSIEARDARDPYTVGTVEVNGVKLRAIFDTGAGSSMLSLEAAKRAGVTPSTPGVLPAGESRGLGRSMVNTWIAPVASVVIGTERVLNIKLRLADVSLPEGDMLIGADFFLSHHVYVANASRHMYFTYDGGPVFDVTPRRIVDQAGAPEKLPADSGPVPTDAAGFSRRAAAEASRRDNKAAIADLDRALALEPGNGSYVFQRARVHLMSGDMAAAYADLDQAVKLAPADPQIRLAHAQSLIIRNRSSEALVDLQTVDASLPSQADERLAVANMFQRLDQFGRAIGDYNLWIAAHPDDSRQPMALNGRCWTRALADTDLPLALKDCNAALRRSKAANFFDSRGLVELRMGQYDRAIADYSAALKLAPKMAWSLYGRGLALRHESDPRAQGDIAAAIAIDPSLPARAQSLGIG